MKTTRDEKIQFVANRATQGLHHLVLPTRNHKDYYAVPIHINMVTMASKRDITALLEKLQYSVKITDLNTYQVLLLLYLPLTVWDEKSQRKWIDTVIDDWRGVLGYSIAIFNAWWGEDSKKLKNNPLTVEKYCKLLNI